MLFKILTIGDIIGKPGRQILINSLKKIKNDYSINLVIANGENAAGGFGITSKISFALFDAGVDVITSGNHIWKNKDVLTIIDKENILRPLNYPDDNPGRGYLILKKNGLRILIINLLGRLNILPTDCPFKKIESLLNSIDKSEYDISIVDFHAETTSEKNAMAWFLDGKVNAVYGTHTHIQTADERILPDGTAYITDIGMTGSFDSVIGMNKENIISHFITRIPIKFKIATQNLGINGAIISIDKSTLKTVNIERFKYFQESDR